MSNSNRDLSVDDDDEEEEEVILFKPKGGGAGVKSNNKTSPNPYPITPQFTDKQSNNQQPAVSFSKQQVEDLDAAVLNLMNTLKIAPTPTTAAQPRSLTTTTTTTSPILLVLDMNGILIYREKIEKGKRGHPPAPQTINALGYRKVNNFRVWERPNLDSFLEFVFSRFQVAVWSSTRRDNLYPIVEGMLGKERVKQLTFLWDQSHCKAEERDDSFPLYLKDIRRIWAEYPKFASGRTLLVDDDEHKAQLNPKFTAIHPKPWTNLLTEDQELGPLGSIRMYLDALANEASINPELKVEDFVQTHPFPFSM